jgi:hypothetical protein
LYIAKGYHILSLLENPWIKRFVMHENPKVVFPSRHHLIKEIFPLTVSKTMDNHVFPTLIHCITCIASFDLWMFCACYNIFAMVISFIDFAWQRVHLIVGLFEIQNTSVDNMAEHVKSLLGSFGLLDKLIAYVKDEVNNLASLLLF